MNTTTKAAAFVAGLGVLFAGAFGVGKVFDDEEARYTLDVVRGAEPGSDRLLIAIADGSGDQVASFRIRHEKELHLIAVRKDFGGYRHLHPERDGSGGWVVPRAGLTPGSWRLYADFQPEGGEPTVVHDDLRVPGEVMPPFGPESDSVVTVDGYEVEFGGRDSLVPGEESIVNFMVSRDGKPVTDLEPYLGANGHLVAIREQGLGFQHVHPDEGAVGAGPDIPFIVAVSRAGHYRLYLEFQHRGVVHTAAFRVEARTGADISEGEMNHGDH